MDLRAVARSRRKRQAQEALEFERDRESALREQLEETVTELEGPGVDAETFARMAPEDVELVREAMLGTEDELDHDGADELDSEWLDELRLTDEPADDREEQLAEVARLEGEIAESQRRQQALRRYLEALDGG